MGASVEVGILDEGPLGKGYSEPLIIQEAAMSNLSWQKLYGMRRDPGVGTSLWCLRDRTKNHVVRRQAR